MMSKISGNFGSKSNSTMKLNLSGSDRTTSDGKPEEDPGCESDSEFSESDNFLAKGAFLLTPSYELNMEKASAICEKMNFKSAFSLTKTATGILFKFANPEDYQAVFKKGFHKVTGARFYRKIAIPCRPPKTYTVFVSEIPEEIPEEDVRHSLYKFNSVVEVTRVQSETSKSVPKIDSGVTKTDKYQGEAYVSGGAPPVVRVTLASLEEANLLLQNGLDFYGATYFPTDTALKERSKRLSIDSPFAGSRVHDLLPVFDAAGFQKIPPPAMKTVRPRVQEFGKK